jgi:signal transduction histidine kinase
MTAGNDEAAAPRPPLAYRLTSGQWLAIDVVTALVMAGVIVFHLRFRGPRFELPTVPMAPLALAATLPVAVRRVAPVAVLAVVSAAIAALTAIGRAGLDLDIMLGLAIYLVAVRSRRPAAIAALIGTEAAIACGIIAAAATGHGQTDTAHSMLAAGALWFTGDGVRERRRYLAEQAAQRQRAAAQREQVAVREERVRIARELHDVVAHTLSVVTFQAGIGRKVGAARPDQALLALRSVEVTGRGALEELRRILGLLRDDTEGPSLAPAPGIGDLDELAENVRAAGVPVRLLVTGNTTALPPAVALTVYRIVQEALTNVVKHAPGSDASVQLSAGADGVLITVTDNGRPSQAAPAAGHGIVGMRERAAAFDGTLEAGPVPSGFRVAAFLPVPGAGPAGAGPVAVASG